MRHPLSSAFPVLRPAPSVPATPHSPSSIGVPSSLACPMSATTGSFPRSGVTVSLLPLHKLSHMAAGCDALRFKFRLINHCTILRIHQSYWLVHFKTESFVACKFCLNFKVASVYKIKLMNTTSTLKANSSAPYQVATTRQPHAARGYRLGWCGCGTFLLLRKVLRDRIAKA